MANLLNISNLNVGVIRDISGNSVATISQNQIQLNGTGFSLITDSAGSTKSIIIASGTSISNPQTQGGWMQLTGNTNGGGGRVDIQSGNVSGANINILVRSADGSVNLGSNSVTMWSISSGGLLFGDATNSGGIVLAKTGANLTPILTGATSIDSDISSIASTHMGLLINQNRTVSDSIVLAANAANNLAGVITFLKTRATAPALDANTIAVNGDELGVMRFMLADGANYRHAAIIKVTADGSPTTGTSSPGAIDFLVTPSGSTTAASAFKLSNDKTATFTGNLVLSLDGTFINPGTVDGTDNKSLWFCGGATNSNTRGGVVGVYGNEAGSPGQVLIRSGDVSGASVVLNAKNTSGVIQFQNNDTNQWRISGSGLQFHGSGLIGAVTADASDVQSLFLAGGGDASAGRGAYIQLAGNDHATTPGYVGILTGNASSASNYIDIRSISPTGKIQLWTSDTIRLTLGADGNLVYTNGTFSINANTSDGSDSSSAQISGGGGTGADDTRAAGLKLFGNEATSFNGLAQLKSGNTTSANAYVEINSPGTNGQIRFATAGTFVWRYSNGGHLEPLVDNTYDAGSSVSFIRKTYTRGVEGILYTNWTPTFGTSGGSVAASTVSVARYALYGKTCFIQMYIQWQIQDAGSSYLTFTLPFTSKNLGVGIFVPTFVNVNAGTTEIGTVFINSNSNLVNVYRAAAATWPIVGGQNHYMTNNFFFEIA